MSDSNSLPTQRYQNRLLPAFTSHLALNTTSRILLVLACLLFGRVYAFAQLSVDQLHQGFLNPPDDSKPMVRWWWFGPAVTKPEILRELQQMKADGIGGAELAFVYPEELDDPSREIRNVPFLSPQHLEAVNYAQTEARKLGLRIDVTLCSGWPYGGPNTPLTEAAGKLRVGEVAVPANTTDIKVPTAAAGDTFLYATLVKGQPKNWTPADSSPLALSIRKVPASSVPRVALFFYAGHTKQQVKRAAVGAEGYVLDPFSHQAVATHLAKVGEPLLSAFGSTPPYAIFSDSLEAFTADWTPLLPSEFKKRRGYDLLPHLPELVAGGTPEAEKIRHDWGVTLTELVNENYLEQINTWATEHHTKFRSQTYGESAVSFSSQRLAALAEGEGPQWRSFSTLRWATSANHVFGNTVSSGETFTWLHSPVFRATPLDMKAEADIDFIMGENQLVFHGWPYSPPQSDIKPGWSLYAAGSFNDNNPWHPVMPTVDKYIQRLSWLLRQGKPSNQVALLLPTDDAWAGFAPGQVSVSKSMPNLVPKELVAAILSAGYNVDFIDAEAINSQGLAAYKILVLPPTQRLPQSTAEKLQTFTAHGGKVIAVGQLPSTDADGNASIAFQQSLAKLFGHTPAIPLQVDLIATALHQAATPDLTISPNENSVSNSLGFIRRTLPKEDIYFVVNTSNKPLQTNISLASTHKFAQQWNPDTGLIASATSTKQPVRFAPYESTIFVVSDDSSTEISPSSPAMSLNLTHDWHVDFAPLHHSLTEHTLTDWTSSPTTLHYSGEAVYARDVTLPSPPKSPLYLAIDGGVALVNGSEPQPEGADTSHDPLVTKTGPGMRAQFAPPIREAATVTVNGNSAGTLWHPPYRLEVSKLLHPGTNHIEIHVFNTALNAWSALPPHDFGPLKAKYGDRFQMQDLDQVKPVSSGILGTIWLTTDPN